MPCADIKHLPCGCGIHHRFLDTNDIRIRKLQIGQYKVGKTYIKKPKLNKKNNGSFN